MGHDIYQIIRDFLAEKGERIAKPKGAWHCTELTGYVLQALARDEVGPGWFEPGTQWWRDIQIMDPELPWSPLAAHADLGKHLGPTGGAVIGPMSPSDLPELAPGMYVGQGWRRLPSQPKPSGHQFFVHVVAPGHILVIESSKANGLRIAGQQWRGGSLPEPGDWQKYARKYVAGIGLAALWTERGAATAPVPEVEEITDQGEERMGVDSKVDVSEDQRLDLIETLRREFSDLMDEAAAGTLTAGDFVESGFDIVIKVATTLIPGELDDMAVGMFKGQLDALKAAAAAGLDRALGVNMDAQFLLERAATRRVAAQNHLAKAAEQEAEGKGTSFFHRIFRTTPQARRERAADLMAMAAQDEAAAELLLAEAVADDAE